MEVKAEKQIAFVAMGALFAIAGLVASQNDLLNPLFKDAFTLSHAEAALIQFVYFGIFFLLAIPVGKLASRFGYQRCMQVGLLVAAGGAMVFGVAAYVGSFSLFLLGILIIAAGNATHIILGNPYITQLSSPEKVAQRLNLINGFYMIGTTLGPALGGWLYIQPATVDPGQVHIDELLIPYLGLGGLLLTAALLFGLLPLPKTNQATQNPDKTGTAKLNLWREKRLLLGIFAMFVYVGAEVSLGSKLVDWLTLPEVMNLTKSEASSYLSIYWGLTMGLRFLSVFLMRYIKPVLFLMTNALTGILLISFAVLVTGPISGWCIVGMGIANAIMFPTIFALATQNLGIHTQQGGSYILMGVVGGAIIPVGVGALSDAFGIATGIGSLVLPYMIIIVFGWVCFQDNRKAA